MLTIVVAYKGTSIMLCYTATVLQRLRVIYVDEWFANVAARTALDVGVGTALARH